MPARQASPISWVRPSDSSRQEGALGPASQMRRQVQRDRGIRLVAQPACP